MSLKLKNCRAVIGVLLACLLLAATATFNSTRAVYGRILHMPSKSETKIISHSPSNPAPNVFFWAWERPEDLHFLNPNVAGVAFLAKTIYLPPRHPRSAYSPSRQIVVRPRLQPLRVAPGAPLIAVARLESRVPASSRTREGLEPVAPTPRAYATTLREQVAGEIADLQLLPGVRAIQIDFDATVSERDFYSLLLSDVRRKLPASFPLSITALASWCIGDSWLQQLPPATIDEAVPMLFRMGPDTATVARFLHSGQEFPVVACQSSLGLSTDESLSRELLTRKLAGIPSSWRDKRIYLFAPRAWTQSAADFALKERQR